MELSALLTILDASALTKKVVTVPDGDAISYVNETGNSLTATVNGTSYTDLIQVCLVVNGESVKVYINSVTRFKLDSIGLGSVVSFSIS